MFGQLLLLLFVSSTFQTHLDLPYILKSYAYALRDKNTDLLMRLLTDNYKLYDCHNNVLMNRETLLKKVSDYESDLTMMLNAYKITHTSYRDDGYAYFQVSVNDVTTIHYIVDRFGTIVSETLNPCNEVKPIITSLIDDPWTIARNLIHRYYYAYLRLNDFDKAIRPGFTITRCDRKTITIDKVLNIFNYTHWHMLPISKEIEIYDIYHKDDQTFVFDLALTRPAASEPHSVIHFEATLVDGKYRLISEHGIICDKAAEISNTLDESWTKIRMIEEIGKYYTQAIRSRDLIVFQGITLKNMKIKVCTESSGFDLLMLRDDYFKILLTQHSKYNSSYENVKNIGGSLIKGEFKWSLDSYSEVFYKADVRTGKLRIFSEERRECLTELEIEDYNTYLRQKMQELIYEFVHAVNQRNEIKFNALTTKSFMTTTLDIRAQPVFKNVTNIADSYPVQLPQLVVTTIPIVENGIIKFSAKAEDFVNHYIAIKTDDRFLLTSEITRKLQD